MIVYRLGFIIDFLSKATLVGFMAGAAVIVSLQQLKGLLGIVHFTKEMEIIPVLSSVFAETKEVKIKQKIKDLSSTLPRKTEFLICMIMYVSDVQWSWKTIVLGFSFLILLLIARLIVSNNLSPKLHFSKLILYSVLN